MSNGLEAVFLNNRTALLRFLSARGAAEASEDLLQELWFRAVRTSSEPIADPVAYLYRAAENLLRDRHRRVAAQRRGEGEWLNFRLASSNQAAQSISGEDLMLARDQLRTIESMLAGLGERTNLIFRRFRVDGLTQKQIADEVGISLSAVEKHLQRAYRALLGLECGDAG